MSGFHVPSSSPSTPDRRGRNGFSFGAASNLSTTPAGPPPSSARSFTPAGPPPPSMFGSSAFSGPGSIKPLSFSQQTTFSPPSQNSFTSPKSSHLGGYSRYAAAPQGSSLSNQYGDYETDDQYQEEDAEDSRYYDSRYGEDDPDMMDEEEEDAEYTQDSMDYDQPYSPSMRTRSEARLQSSSKGGSDLLLTAPVKLGESVTGAVPDLRSSLRQAPDQEGPSTYAKIAQDLCNQMGTPNIEESADLILDTESAILKLYHQGVGAGDDPEALQQALTVVPGELTRLWREYDKNTTAHNSEEYTAAIGPGGRASNFAKANFLATLLLQIHHPAMSEARGFTPKPKPLPQIMLEWIDEFHDPYPSQFEEIQAHRPAPSHHRLFWDTLLNGLLRGRVVAVIHLLQTAGWQNARVGLDDIRDKSSTIGYSGIALANVERVINAAAEVLKLCPAVHGDWDIRGGDWTLFRLRASQALEELKQFAGAGDSERHTSSVYEPEGFETSSRSGTYSRIAKRAESKVPWNIYQNLLTLYGMIMGDSSAIIPNAQDWCEAAIGLLVWWDEGKNDRQLVLGQSRASYHGSSKISDSEAYHRKLGRSFRLATADSTDFQVNTLSPVEVGLASIFEGETEAVIGILRAWSGPVSSAVAEIASIGGWLPVSEPQNLITMGSLDQDDMAVLGIDSSPKTDGVKDHTLITYAVELSLCGEFRSNPRRGRAIIVKEGWELAIAILGRLDSVVRTDEMVGKILEKLPLDSTTTVDKLWRLLNQLGMDKHAERTAESYANGLKEKTHNYGEAIWYYALAHKTDMVKEVLNLLIARSLIYSTVYPQEKELDEHLSNLIWSPKKTLTELSKMDADAAELVYKMLSGYATLRRFYTLRDGGGTLTHSPATRRADAASALLALIASSDDNIRGGLYDESRGAVVSVDYLLALLGEAMVFVNQPDSTLKISQIETLLKSIEDIQTAGSRVYSACDVFFNTVLASASGLKGSTPYDMLRQSTSNISGSSSFSLVESSMVASQLKQSMSGSLPVGNVKRGWDWRSGLTASTTSADLLRMLRLGLAKDLARARLAEVDGRL
ncbi:hypothetical protein F5884DRAFT_750046 [Xylogone sp. PMI_703]|nr:hypothetical protein F5884DRAFT_750046 [Xylogone sp. PMI_703]